MNIESADGIRPRVIGIAFLYSALAAVVFFFAFCNLDGRLFWGDEAETAVLARNILKFGVPRVDDGVNHISLHGDKFDARNGIWTWSPWLQNYIAAASFAIFGQTTWAGRAPFAFIGWLAVMLLGFTAWKIYKSHRVALAAMSLLGTSEVFLLHIRQCRYYSITVLAEILLIFGIYQVLAKNKSGPWLLVLALTVQFYCNYTIAAANLPLLLLLAANLFRQNKSSALPVLMSLGIWVLLCAPWLLYTEIWRQGAAEKHESWTQVVGLYVVQFHFHFFPWCVVLLPVFGWLLRRFSKRPNQPQNPQGVLPRFEIYLFLLPFLYAPVLLLMPGGFLRYLLPVLAAMCLLVSVWLFRYVRWTALAVALLLVQCVSNVFAVATDPFARQYPLRSPLADFVFGAMLPYDDRSSDVLKFFNKQARPGDVLVSWDPEFPLMFYTPLKVVDARLLSSPLQRLPDWILPVSLSDAFSKTPVALPDNIKPYYETITLTVHNSPRVDAIPEPDYYQSQSARTMASFVIYQLKAQSPTNNFSRQP